MLLSLKGRFWSKVSMGDGCWAWLGARTAQGYGKFKLAPGRSERAHRAAWILTSGPIPAGLYVCHRCDNPSCVRPDHLFLGTIQDNNADRDQKGRNSGLPAMWAATGAKGRAA